MSNRSLKVMHLILNLDIGGAQEVVRTLVEHLALDACLPIVCTFNDGPLRQDIEQLGIKVEVLPGRRYSVLAFPWFVADILRIYRSLVRLINEYEIDVIQTHLLTTLDFLVLALKYTTSVRVVLWTFHSFNFELAEDELPKHKWLLKPKRHVHRQLYRLTSSLTNGFVAVSNEVKAAMVKIIGADVQDKIIVICNGVNVKRYGHAGNREQVRTQLGFDKDARLIAMVGTLKKVKGHRYMIEAMASLVPQYPDLHLILVGDGELREELQTQVKKLGLCQHIHFLGNRSNVAELLEASDYFVLPSLWEGLSMALLEAMITGLPTVASEVSGTVQVITPGETGVLVPPGDIPGLIAALTQLLSDPAQAQRLGQAAKQYVQANFSAQKQANEHLALYQCQLSDKPLITQS